MLKPFFIIKSRDALIAQIYFVKKLYIFGQFLCPLQEFFTVHSAMCHAVPNVQWKTPDDGQGNCPKNVEILDKINLGN